MQNAPAARKRPGAGHEGISSVPRKTVEQRFWAKVDGRGPDDCWEWTGWRHQFGYGLLGVRKRDDSGPTSALAHRLSWEFANGPIPDGMWVLHRCDNAPCCNPAHLFLGTHQDNMDDMASKRRAKAPRGERQHLAKLTAQDVLQIRARCPQETRRALADEFGVAVGTIHQIVNRLTWTHI